MCIAIFKPQGKIVTKTALHRSFTVNGDGAGYVFADKGKLIIKKGFFRFKDFWREFRNDMGKYGNPTTLIHFRIATHGRIDADNCHPFAVGKNFAFIHNGVIDCAMPEKEMSDTFNFGKFILSPLVKEFGAKIFESSAMGDLLGMSIGYSKLAIIDRFGEVTLVNSEMGVWDAGVWYSNESYQPKTVKKYYGTTRGSSGGWGDEAEDFSSEDYTKSHIKPKSPSKYDDAMEIAQRYKHNAGEEVSGFNLNELKGLSLAEVTEMTDEDFFSRIVPIADKTVTDNPPTQEKEVQFD